MTLVLLALLAANGRLVAARADYENLDFEKCVGRLEGAAAQGGTRDELRDIQLYAGLCHFNLGHRRTAAGCFQEALRIDPGAAVPDYTSPKAEELFDRVRKAELSQKPFVDTDLPDDAPREAKLLPRERPALPTAPAPAWTRHAVPLALAGVALAAVACAIGLGAHAKTLELQANRAWYESDFVALGNAARDNAVGATIAWIIAALSAGGSAATFFLSPAPPPADAAH